jgi:hypothetical protein
MRVVRKAQAAQFAANVLPINRNIQAAGFTASTPSPGSSTAPNPLLLNGVSRSAGCRSLLVRQPLGTLSVLC